MHALNLTGQCFGRLTVLYRADDKRGEKVLWVCRCDCGAEIKTATGVLRAGHSQSCGCLRRDRIAEACHVHGACNTPEYRSWKGMKQRCLNPKNPRYPSYGGRGISICDAWIDSFETFLLDMGPRPEGHSLDRIDNDGHYEPTNTRWATGETQQNNCSRNHRIVFRGENRTLSEWARHVGIPVSALLVRLSHGWPIDRVLMAPSMKPNELRGVALTAKQRLTSPVI